MKSKILANIESPYFLFWTLGSTIGYTPNHPPNFVLDNINRKESLWVWLEMLTRVISIDANLENEQKFNLLDGECGLNAGEVIHRSIGSLGGNVYNSDRARWNYTRLGSVSSSSPYTYTPPRIGNYRPTSDSTITIGTDTLTSENWLDWLRS